MESQCELVMMTIHSLYCTTDPWETGQKLTIKEEKKGTMIDGWIFNDDQEKVKKKKKEKKRIIKRKHVDEVGGDYYIQCWMLHRSGLAEF